MKPHSRATSAHRLVTPSAPILGLVLLASACTGPREEQSEGSAVSSHTVVDAMGEVEFEATPERVVVLDSPALDALLALGVTPVGATEIDEGTGFPAYLDEDLEDTEKVGAVMAPNLEAIAELDPDLILGSKMRHADLHDQLTDIAPTVFAADVGTDWTEQADLTAAALGRSEEMGTLLDDLSDRAARVAESIDANGKTASMVRFRTENFRLYGPETFSGSILTDMGFDLGAREWDESSMMEVGSERFEEIDGDVVFYTGAGADAESTTASTVTELWGEQPGVKAGQAFSVSEDTWIMGVGVIGGNLVIDDIEASLG